MAPARSNAASLLTASALLVALAALWCEPVEASSGIVKATKPRHKPSKDRFAELSFYLHDIALDPNATAFYVVPPLDGIPASPVGVSQFGGVVVIDDKLTAGPSQSSLEVGRAKGLYVFDSLDASNPGIEIVLSIVLNEASGFPGSTIQLRGFNRDLLPDPVREISISGGTGKFRLARGWTELVVVAGSGFSVSINFIASVYYGGSGRYH